MLQRFVDNLLAVAKESVKTFTYESLNNIARLINGFSALLLAILPGNTNILEGIHGWELRPTFRGPRFPRWMENGVSSFNQFLHNLPDDSDSSSNAGYASGEEDNEESIHPGSPTSQASHLSRASSFRRYDRRLVRTIKYFFSWIMWPVSFLMGLTWLINWSVGFRRSGIAHSGHLTKRQSADLRTKKTNSIKQHVVHRTTDRRRGVIEDLQLAIEIFIEGVFDIFHKAAHLILNPSEAFQILSRWFFPPCQNGGFFEKEQSIPVPTDTLSEDIPTTTERQATFHQSLNTDARTCEDVIREHGYPYEAIHVITSDGYVLLLERIPRRDSKKVVYLQHGILDSSLGWVSNGVVGSPAFAAFDQGYDVYLGNLRGLVSREHVDKNISSCRYWRYSINEHGTEDVPAIVEKIHEVKTSELGTAHQSDTIDDTTTNNQPYRICAVCHSLGGAVMLMYVITRRIVSKPHRLARLILLSPAGFHGDSTLAFTVVEHLTLLLGPIIAPFVPGLYIPTRFFRMLLNKLARDFQNYPALGGLVQTLMSYVVGGDSSNWVGALGLTHYNMYDMPGVSLRVAIHLAQMKRSKKFMMFDYGNAGNMEVYGSPEPIDLGQNYNLIDIPIDLVAGQRDQVIRPSMVKKHYKIMRKAKVEVSFNEFEYAHLDFTFSHREELLAYVMSRVLLVANPDNQANQRNNLRERKIKKNHSRNGGSHLGHIVGDEHIGT